MDEFERAAECYETLSKLYPEEESYKVYHVQSLVQNGSYADASHAAATASSTMPSSSRHTQRIRLLQAHAEMEQGKLTSATATLSHCVEDDHETILALATKDYCLKKFDSALQTYKIARQLTGDQPILSYYIALCHYQLKNYDVALGLVDELINSIENEDTSDQESMMNHEFVVEAINLKAAILHATKVYDAAKDTMSCFHDNLDAITIHNDVIINSEDDPNIAIQKLEFLLSEEISPTETLHNLLTLYASHGQEHLAAETFQANKDLAKEVLPREVYGYFDALQVSITSREDAITMLEKQVSTYIPKLRSGKKDVSSAESMRPATSHRLSTASTARPTTASERKTHQAVAAATQNVEAILDYYIPTLCLQAKLNWDKEDYSAAEQVLRKGAADFCTTDNDSWSTENMGHIMFAQDKFEDSIQHYESILALTNANEDILEISPVVLGNLCVCYIMTNQNEAAEDIIKTVEREEQQRSALGGPDEQTNHCSCMINLVIGTLYCNRGNYEFGIDRVCKSLQPCEKNLSLDTWIYARQCFLDFASKVSKLMIHIKQDTLENILDLLSDVESHGKHILTTESKTDDEESDSLNSTEPETLSTQAKQLKNLYIKICA